MTEQNAVSDWPSDLVVHTAAALRHSHKDCGCPLTGIGTEDVIEVLDEWKRQTPQIADPQRDDGCPQCVAIRSSATA